MKSIYSDIHVNENECFYKMYNVIIGPEGDPRMTLPHDLGQG